MTDFTILISAIPHPAIEERYAHAQSRLLVSRDTGAEVRTVDPGESGATIASDVQTEFAVVLTDPLLVSPPGLAGRLVEALRASSVDAAVPVLNESDEPGQQAKAFEAYLTLSQLEEQATRMLQERSGEPRLISWKDTDPGLFAIRTRTLRSIVKPIAGALEGLDVAVLPNLFAHRFASQRGQLREDLLERIPKDATRVLEFGCGEGALAAALKARQECRVVGIEIDPASAKIARQRVDFLHTGDIRQLIDDIDERFDFIVGGDVLEHVDDPWTLLRELRKVAATGAGILLSLPNIACWPIVRDLMRGRFDYVYMGITCAGHLRFFTRRTIEEMLAIAGWSVVSVSPQDEFRTPDYDAWLSELGKTMLPYSEEELLTPGYYVIAENGG